MNPPPLPMSPHVNSSRGRGRSSSFGINRLHPKLSAKTHSINSHQQTPTVIQSVPSLTESAPATELEKPADVSGDISDNEAPNDSNRSPRNTPLSRSTPASPRLNNVSFQRQLTPRTLETMVLSDQEISNGDIGDGKRQYWVTVPVCASYQNVGGTRYRLLPAHRLWYIDELREIYHRRYQV